MDIIHVFLITLLIQTIASTNENDTTLTLSRVKRQFIGYDPYFYGGFYRPYPLPIIIGGGGFFRGRGFGGRGFGGFGGGFGGRGFGGRGIGFGGRGIGFGGRGGFGGGRGGRG